MYAMRCLAEGDQAALRNMNFGVKEIEALREMRVADLYRVESLRAHCLEIALNRQVYWPMIEHLSEQRSMEDTIQTLIVADAPQEMMQILFGLNQRDYTRLRRILLVDPSVGRPPELDEASSHRLWEAWSAGLTMRSPVCDTGAVSGDPCGNRCADARDLGTDATLGPIRLSERPGRQGDRSGGYP